MGFQVGAQRSNQLSCTRPVEYWRNNPDEWPPTNHDTPHVHVGPEEDPKFKHPYFDLDQGNVDMTVQDIFELDDTEDKTVIMAKELSAAALNRNGGVTFWCIRGVFQEARAWMAEHGPVGSGKTEWDGGEEIYDRLQSYNSEDSCACGGG